MNILLTVNGRKRSIEVKPNETLLQVLRERLSLTGAKKGCDLGDCGACTVLLNSKAVNSCLVLAPDAEGCEIVTVEGLAKDGDLHLLQKAFVEEGAVQCGYCTAGLLMVLASVLQKNPHPTQSEIVEAIEGNLCRCGTYPHVISAVSKATKKMEVS